MMKEVQNITMIDDYETNQAKIMIKKANIKVMAFFPLVFIITFVAAYFSYDILNKDIKTICVALSFGAPILIYFIASYFYLDDFYKIYKLAKLNDKIRHEEKIRYIERQRLDKENIKVTKGNFRYTINKIKKEDKEFKKQNTNDKK